jgi:hypothetical protein
MDPEETLAHNARGLDEDPHLESIEALQARMLHVESALMEILQHVRPANN